MAEAGAALSGRAGEVLRVFAERPARAALRPRHLLVHRLVPAATSPWCSAGSSARGGWRANGKASTRRRRAGHNVARTGSARRDGQPSSAPAGHGQSSRGVADSRGMLVDGSPLPIGVELAGTLCDLAADALPVADRQRYRAEWRADVAADPVHGLQYALSILPSPAPVEGGCGRTGRSRTRAGSVSFISTGTSRSTTTATTGARRATSAPAAGTSRTTGAGPGRAGDSLAWASFSRGNSLRRSLTDCVSVRVTAPAQTQVSCWWGGTPKRIVDGTRGPGDRRGRRRAPRRRPPSTIQAVTRTGSRRRWSRWSG